MKNYLPVVLVAFLLSFLSGCAVEKPIKIVNGDYEEAHDVSEPPPNLVALETKEPMQGQLKPLDETLGELEEEATFIEYDEPGVSEVQITDPLSVVVQPKPIAFPSEKNKGLLQDKDLANLLTRAKQVNRKQPTAVFNEQARVRPTAAPTGWINAITLYDYMEGALYQIYSTPGHTTDIMFQPGEQIIASAAGDTLRWKVDITKSGSGLNGRQHLFVKPTKPNLSTNLTVTTDRRVYYLELHSQAKGAYMAGCSWNYPNDFLLTKYKNAEQKADKVDTNIAISDLHSLNFDYDLKVIKGGSWKPVRVFDNGKKTYIQFPEDMQYREAPVLFIVGKKGTHQIVNYRKKKGYYVVDRLFARAELREGLKEQEVVRIVNNSLYTPPVEVEDESH